MSQQYLNSFMEKLERNKHDVLNHKTVTDIFIFLETEDITYRNKIELIKLYYRNSQYTSLFMSDYEADQYLRLFRDSVLESMCKTLSLPSKMRTYLPRE